MFSDPLPRILDAPNRDGTRYEIRLTRVEADTHRASMRVARNGRSFQRLIDPEVTNWMGGYVFPNRKGADVIAQYDRGIYVWSSVKGGHWRVAPFRILHDASIEATGKFGALVASDIDCQRGERTYQRTVYYLWDARTRRWKALGGKGRETKLGR